MGKVLHKLIRGVLPSWLLKRFFRSRALRHFSYFKLRQLNYAKAGPSPNLPSSSSSLPASPAAAYILRDGEESTYYYSYSEDEHGIPSMQAGHGGDTSSSASCLRCKRGRRDYSDVYLQYEHQNGHHSQFEGKGADDGDDDGGGGDEDDDGSGDDDDDDDEVEDDDSSHDNCSHQYMQAKGVHHYNCHSHELQGRLDNCSPHLNLLHHRGYKRKSLVLTEDDGGNNDGNDVRSYSCLMKRQKGANVGYELPGSISEVVGQGSIHVQYSYQEPQLAFWESMVDMIVSNELWNVNSQESLLLCYLTLNEPHLYSTICTSFLQALEDLSFLVNS